jgi:hypothetical protein
MLAFVSAMFCWPHQVKAIDDGVKLRLAFQAEIRSLFEKGAYAELESLEEKLRISQEMLPEGFPKSKFFNLGIVPLDMLDEDAWVKCLERLSQWEKSFPRSIAAPVAHASVLVSYAWKARGGGYSDTVRQEGWQLFEERLASARRILEAASESRQKSAEWFDPMLRIGMGQNWERRDYDRLFDEACKRFPQYTGYYYLRAVNLLPRWHGSEGEWEADLKEKCLKLDKEQAYITYARTVWAMDAAYYGNIFQESKVEWSLVKPGFDLLRKRFPDSEWNLNKFCRIAIDAGDDDAARIWLKQIGDKPMMDVWKKRATFVEAQNRLGVTSAVTTTPSVAPSSPPASLADLLPGTKWKWNGSGSKPLEFRKDGKVTKADWDTKGLVTGWEVSGPNEIKLTVRQGRTTNLNATLHFAADRESFSGMDFNGSALKKSSRAQ